LKKKYFAFVDLSCTKFVFSLTCLITCSSIAGIQYFCFVLDELTVLDKKDPVLSKLAMDRNKSIYSRIFIAGHFVFEKRFLDRDAYLQFPLARLTCNVMMISAHSMLEAVILINTI